MPEPVGPNKVTPQFDADIVNAQTPGGISMGQHLPDDAGETPQEPNLSGAPAGAPPALPGGQPVKPPTAADKVARFISGGQQTPGQLWRGVLGGALAGMGAGAATGHFGAGVGAGAGAQQAAQQRANQVQQQNLENQRQGSRDAADLKLKQAQWVDLNHKIAESSWTLSHAQNVAQTEAAQQENAIKEIAANAPGSIDLGVVRNGDDLVALHKANPNLPQDASRANILTIPHFTPVVGADGKETGEMKNDGFSAVYVAPDWMKQKIDKDVTIPTMTPGKKPGDPATWTNTTLKAGTVTNGEALKLGMDQSAQVGKYDSESVLARGQAALARAQAASMGKPGDLSAQDLEDLGRMVASDPTHLDLKSLVSLKGNARAKVFLAAKRYDSNFNPQKAGLALDTMKDFQTGDTSKQLTSFNGAIRHLGMLMDAAQMLNNGDATALNRLGNELGLQMGDDKIANYNAIHAAVTGEVGKVYKGSSPTDQEIGIMDKAFSDAQSPKQALTAGRTTMRLMGEKIQDKYRTFKNGTGQTPEQNGIELVNPDVQQLFQRNGLTVIGPNGPPEKVQIPAGMVQVQIPGMDPGMITKNKLAEFQKKHPDGVVIQ